MPIKISRKSGRVFLAAALLAVFCVGMSGAAAVTVPDPSVDISPSTVKGSQTAVFAGGCFWCIQPAFDKAPGVIKTTVGYCGGTEPNPTYELVGSEKTKYRESIEIVYDPAKVTYGELLRVFFSVALDPTEVNRQGPDEGPQYRSVIFYGNDEQKKIAEAYIAQLDQAKAFHRKIATQVTPLQAFYPAEGYHQNYAELHPNQPYIVYNDAPKVANLRKEFPQLYTGK